MMKITLRLIIALFFVATLVAFLSSILQIQTERDRLTADLTSRTVLLAETFEESIQNLLYHRSISRLTRFVERFENRERFLGVVVYDTLGTAIAASPTLSSLSAAPPQLKQSIEQNKPVSSFDDMAGRQTLVYAAPVMIDSVRAGSFVIFQDASYIDTRMLGIWERNLVRLFVLMALIIVTTVLMVRWSIIGPVMQITEWMKNLRLGRAAKTDLIARGDILEPLAIEASLMAKSLAVARASAEEEARLRVEGDSLWTAERLKGFIRRELGTRNLIVVSNREPYMHVKQGKTIECIVPAGGLVTALDPILRACGGTWMAHGSGDADREMCDERGHVPVPPEDPSYTLKRMFLTKEEEEGYYYGFSNEGIWPLCHITHTRPVFRLDDWVQYQRVNERFAQELLEEIREETDPLILIQDYHFSLLPALIKAERPDARVAIFWHIPWPNPEAFSICPWKKEMLLGLLGADLIGFHVQFHCNNFMETVDRSLESKINWDRFSIERRGATTAVRPFPISVDFPSAPAGGIGIARPLAAEKQEQIRRELGMSFDLLGVGVDRIDYTKGIVERFRAVERLLEKHPELLGRFTFVELGAPSRTHIKRYHDLMAELDECVDKINWRFQTKTWRPIIFLKAHHNHATVNKYYEAADVCAVTSLHDGMNLVAKEFIVSRSDEDGVLILSEFTGAAHELHEALIVNPYDIEGLADSMHQALTMSVNERKERMRALRRMVRERNVYRWAATIITSLSQLKPSPSPTEEKA